MVKRVIIRNTGEGLGVQGEAPINNKWVGFLEDPENVKSSLCY